MLDAEHKSECVALPPDEPMPSSRNGSIRISVAYRQQTPEEQRQFGAIFRVFLAELVSQQTERERVR